MDQLKLDGHGKVAQGVESRVGLIHDVGSGVAPREGTTLGDRRDAYPQKAPPTPNAPHRFEMPTRVRWLDCRWVQTALLLGDWYVKTRIS